MSHYSTIQTRLKQIDALVKALEDLGLAHVEVHDEPQHLHGYQGDRRKQMAEVIIRRKHVGRASNDIGFKRTADGFFEAIISDYDRSKYSQKWLERLTQRYAYHVARRQLADQHFDLIEEKVDQAGQIHLVLRRMA